MKNLLKAMGDLGLTSSAMAVQTMYDTLRRKPERHSRLQSVSAQAKPHLTPTLRQALESVESVQNTFIDFAFFWEFDAADKPTGWGPVPTRCHRPK